MRKASLLFDVKHRLDDGAVLSIRIWSVPAPVPPSSHRLKYSLSYGYPGQRLIGYDNERGKGDHKHVRGIEHPYVFVSLDALIDDFMADVAAMREGSDGR